MTLRQCLTDLKELQAAGSLTDLLAPSGPGKLYSAIERKAAGWAVMDADFRRSDSSAGACSMLDRSDSYPEGVLVTLSSPADYRQFANTDARLWASPTDFLTDLFTVVL